MWEQMKKRMQAVFVPWTLKKGSELQKINDGFKQTQQNVFIFYGAVSLLSLLVVLGFTKKWFPGFETLSTQEVNHLSLNIVMYTVGFSFALMIGFIVRDELVKAKLKVINKKEEDQDRLNKMAFSLLSHRLKDRVKILK